MGWHVTCTICGRTDKHGLYCDCYEKEVKRLIEGKKGCIIMDCFEDCYGLYECLKRENGEIYYLFTSLFNGYEASAFSQKVVEIDKESYEKAKQDRDNPDRNSDDEEREDNDKKDDENDEEKDNNKNEEFDEDLKIKRGKEESKVIIPIDLPEVNN